MSYTCPTCAFVNPDQSIFCVRCGNRFQAAGQASQAPQTPSNSPISADPVYGSPGFAPSYSSPSSSQQSPPSPSFTPPVAPPPSASQWASPSTASSSYPGQMGTGQGQGQFSMRRAFAGHGISVMHYSWLLDGKEKQATTVLSTILDLLRQRGIGGLAITPERLTERGINLEERDYLKVRRGVSSVFIYVAPAGRDLYLSRATTVLPAINIMRVIGLLLLLALALFGPGFLQSMAGPAGYLLGGLFFLFVLPIWLYFIWLLFRSFSYWLVEKDFWVYLRANQLNDFQLDDIALMEHVTDETIRAAVEQLGLDASKILPPTQGYQPKQRIRII
jgi:hypothetical protein